MNYGKWIKTIKKHLGYYKTNKMGITEKGIFIGNKKEYDHILPLEKAEKNYMCHKPKILLPKSDRHRDWYHLNSSQTLCVNYFAPLDDNDLSKLLSHVTNKTIKVADKQFEYIPVKNSTSFDFHIVDHNKNNYYFEVKYTENGITKKGGGTNQSATYKTYYEEEVKNNPLFKNIDEDCFMNHHFQAYRNMIKGIGENYSIFITMKSNSATNSELNAALNNLHATDTHNIIFLYWEDLIDDTIEIFKDNPELASYYKEFKKKYLPLIV